MLTATVRAGGAAGLAPSGSELGIGSLLTRLGAAAMARKRRWKQRIRTARPSVHVIQARMTDGSHRPEGGDKALGSRLRVQS